MFKRKKKEEIEEKKIKRYRVKYNRGLTNYQVNKRERDGLTNKKVVNTSRSYKEIIIHDCFNFYNIVLLVLGIILLCFGLWSSCGFLIILVCNVALTLGQDIKAKRILDKISLMKEEEITVIRDGKERKIKSDELVLDDVYIVKKDMQIPCDSTILEGEVLMNESLVTGESVPRQKKLYDTILSGSYVTSGYAYAQVDAVGKDNYVEKLQATAKQKKTTPSQTYETLNKLFKVISLAVVVLGILEAVLTCVVGYQSKDPSLSIYEWLQQNVVGQVAGAIVMMIPSGMYLLTSVALSIGVIALSKQKVAVQDMYSIETTARVDTLCIDKTGTITDGTMAVLETKSYSKEANANFLETLISSYNACAKEQNYTQKTLNDKYGTKLYYTPLEDIPFNSVFKYGAASFEKVGTICIGAYGFVPIKENRELKKDVDDYSKKGYRVLVVARSEKMIVNGVLPSDMHAIGLIILYDHIRKNAKEIISWFQSNDVNIKVISGDNELTVKEIAKLAGVKNAEKYVSLAGKTDEEVRKLVNEYSVFGRVSPEQKEIIVEELKKEGHTVAMFGDGINDLLGMKSANVSISINSGAKAARDISSFLIMDDDWEKLTGVVHEGRRSINNLQRSCSLFLIKTVYAFIMNVFFLIFGSVMWFCYGEVALWPFTTNNFYPWELVTIGLASFLLTFEKNNERIKGDFSKNIMRESLMPAIILSAAIIGYFLYSNLTGLTNNIDIDRTVTTYVTSFSSLVFLFEVCLPFNLYRRVVFVISLVVMFIPFVFCIYSIPELNILQLYGDEAPRYLSTRDTISVIVLIVVVVVLLLAYYISKYYIEKRREKNERDRAANSKTIHEVTK